MSDKEECVILLHGLGRTWRSMEPIADVLEAEGYYTVNVDYPSRDEAIELLAIRAVPEGIAQCAAIDAKAIHFVTHSMGGILLRYYLGRHQLELLGHIVMYSPPNHGSEITDELRKNFFYRWFNGPAGLQLGTDFNSLPATLGRATYSVGIITGSQNSFIDIFFTSMIPGADDGKVSVESARLEGMTDFLVVPEAHPFIMTDDVVLAQTIHFIRYGYFQHCKDHEDDTCP